MSATDLPQRLQEANANDQFRRRWSPRSMTAAPLAQSDLEQLFEAERTYHKLMLSKLIFCPQLMGYLSS